MWHIPSHHSCREGNVQWLGGCDKCTLKHCLLSSSSAISQHFIHVRIVALNTVYISASCYVSKSPKTSKLHSSEILYTSAHTMPSTLPMQSGGPICICWLTRQSIFQVNIHWFVSNRSTLTRLNLLRSELGSATDRVTLDKSTTSFQSHFFSLLCN